MKTIDSEKIPIKLWLDDIEEGALLQAKNLANFEHAFHHVAIMPDAHEGYGMPIGGILATKDVVIPNAVGVDIGCGMIAVQTNLEQIEIQTLKKILGEIRRSIPVGFDHQVNKQDTAFLPLVNKEMQIASQQFEAARIQVGTLGGGNHFIEIQKGSDGRIWIMVHSGSRNMGKRVADHYNQIAIDNRKRFNSHVPIDWKLDFLPNNSKEGELYLSEMQYCIDFAFANRKLMLDRIIKILKNEFENLVLSQEINIAHNYASLEKHFGEMVMIHRKGSTQAKLGQLGIIPGSQGTKSFIVRGKGNAESFESCSHGAGRKMSRNAARKYLNLQKEKEILDSRGILHAIRGKKDLDEAPSAYKNIDDVMKFQTDLVEIIVELNPIAVVKG